MVTEVVMEGPGPPLTSLCDAAGGVGISAGGAETEKGGVVAGARAIWTRGPTEMCQNQSQ